MTVHSSVKGKKRACDPGPSIKKPKRAETKQCPICAEHIPIRLLGAHCDFETERTEQVIRAVGSLEIFGDSGDGIQFSRDRRSAARARKAFQPRASGSMSTTEKTEKAIRAMKRHRKERHNRLREITRDEDVISVVDGSTCPMCLTVVQGDPDVVEAHVDSCLAHAIQVQERQNHTDEWDEDDTIIRVTDGANLTASGFHVRNQDHQDMEDDVDVDGDDNEVFGQAQFTEIDVLSGLFTSDEPSFDEQVNAEAQINNPLRDLVANGKVVKRDLEGHNSARAEELEHVSRVGDADKMDIAIIKARQGGDQAVLIHALEEKIRHLESMCVSSSTPSVCRVCLDPYVEPTVSTLCWHTCCRECWLRCLSTRLCPICKKITGAEHLRRVYL